MYVYFIDIVYVNRQLERELWPLLVRLVFSVCLIWLYLAC